MVTCPWCGTQYPVFQPNCNNCGGPLKMLPGQGLGSKPVNPPREVPDAFVLKIKKANQLWFILGWVFTIVGVFTFFMPIFLILGLIFLRKAKRDTQNRLLAIRDGIPAVAKIAAVYLDTSEVVNGRSPYMVEYSFSTGSIVMNGKVHTWDFEVVQYQPGEEFYVVYLPENPKINSPYPPF